MSEIASTPDDLGHRAAQGGRSETNRQSLFQELYAKLVDEQAHADGGNLWVATVATAATITGGTASHAAPTATDGTRALLLLKNGNTAASKRRIYPLRITLGLTVAGAGATSSRFYIEKSAAGVNRFTSGGVTNVASSGLVLNNPGTQQVASSAQVYFGAVVSPADTAATLLAEGLIRSIIPTFGDRVSFLFGDKAHGGATDYSTAAAIRVEEIVPACYLEPGETMALHLVNASQSGASSYHLKLRYMER
jgi:hypothetical protein